jgi:DNA-binding beta-propeller fold protein YncE
MNKISPFLSTCVLLLSAAVSYAQTPPLPVLTAGTALAVPGPAGKFDYMTFDPAMNRVFASDPGAKALVVVDVATSLMRTIPLGTEVNGVAVDAEDGKFFTAGGGGVVFQFDRKKMLKMTSLTLDGPADAICFDPDNDTLYIDNDDGTKVWAMNASSDTVVAAIPIDGAPEYMAYDPATKHLYQNIKTTNEIQTIDTTSNKVISTWPTAPATKPHGLAFDPVSNRLLCGGRNDMLAVVDPTNGQVVTTVPLASGTDQIAFDSKLRRLYAIGGGFVTVVTIAKNGTPTVLGQVTAPPGAHTIAVDPNTDTVWISYPQGDTSYLQPFTPSL